MVVTLISLVPACKFMKKTLMLDHPTPYNNNGNIPYEG